jgi:hypothetical protein
MGVIAHRFVMGLALSASVVVTAVGLVGGAGADPTPAVTLPAMTSTGAGPIIGAGGAAAGISQQLTSLGSPGVQEVDGSDAAAFITAAASDANPQLAGPFTLLKRALACQINNAGFGARAYRRSDGLWGGAMLVAAKSTVPNVDALVSCARTNWRRSTVGGENAMCNNGWTTPTSGVRNSEAYYIMLAGTAADFCADLNGRYKDNAGGWPN